MPLTHDHRSHTPVVAIRRLRKMRLLDVATTMSQKILSTTVLALHSIHFKDIVRKLRVTVLPPDDDILRFSLQSTKLQTS